MLHGPPVLRSCPGGLGQSCAYPHRSERERSVIVRSMLGAGEEGGGPDPIWGPSGSDREERERSEEGRGGRLRRRAVEAGRQVNGVAPPAAPTSAPAASEEAGDLWSALTAVTERLDVLSDAVLRLRTDMNHSLADLAGGVTAGQEQTRQEISDALDRSLETTRTELNGGFQGELESLTAMLSDALGQIAGHLERLSIASGDNRDAVDKVTGALETTSSRLDQLGSPPAVDVGSLTGAVSRVGDLVEALLGRVG